MDNDERARQVDGSVVDEEAQGVLGVTQRQCNAASTRVCIVCGCRFAVDASDDLEEPSPRPEKTR